MKIYNKLVRDNIPKNIKSSGLSYKTRILDEEEYLKHLINKLLEEAKEVKDKPTKEELADVLEVLKHIAKRLNISMKDIEQERKRKKKANGGFVKKIFLISTE
ncbi:MAG TPA: nucleoside triphosphate pyrophosphohydrolase [Patescibacteria group bacterium]|nr:nucleoside triphosphate pyrophosphohydrolase [Patescibacteria group bacterium]